MTKYESIIQKIEDVAHEINELRPPFRAQFVGILADAIDVDVNSAKKLGPVNTAILSERLAVLSAQQAAEARALGGLETK